MTEIKQSLMPNSDRGVFTTRKFSNGEDVCFYDGYVNKNPTHIERKYLLQDYVIGLMAPKTSDGVAQLINDGGNIILDPDELNKMNPKDAVRHILDKIAEYYIFSDERRNVEIRYPPKIGSRFYAIRDIEKGEELYFRYGYLYWLDLQYDKLLNVRICKTVILSVADRHKNQCNRSRKDKVSKIVIATALKYLDEGKLDTFISDVEKMSLI